MVQNRDASAWFKEHDGDDENDSNEQHNGVITFSCDDSQNAPKVQLNSKDKNHSDESDEDTVVQYNNGIVCSGMEIDQVSDSVDNSNDKEYSTSTSSSAAAAADVGGGDDDDDEDNDDQAHLQVGDHVFLWCSMASGVLSRAYQHHGIVVDVNNDKQTATIVDFNASAGTGESTTDLNTDGNDNNDNKDDDDDSMSDNDHKQDGSSFFEGSQGKKNNLTSNTNSSQSRLPTSQLRIGGFPLSSISTTTAAGSLSSFGGSANSSTCVNGSVSTSRELPHTGLTQRTISSVLPKHHSSEWSKVAYRSGWMEQVMHRAGTRTTVSSDPTSLVLARIQFLADHPDLIPSYHALTSNCECVAVWCKTGTWTTLEAAGVLTGVAAVGNMGASAWGLLALGSIGAVEAVSFMAMAPLVVGGGLLLPLVTLNSCRAAWEETTKRLNNAFWGFCAIHRQDLLVEAIHGPSILPLLKKE